MDPSHQNDEQRICRVTREERADPEHPPARRQERLHDRCTRIHARIGTHLDNEPAKPVPQSDRASAAGAKLQPAPAEPRARGERDETGAKKREVYARVARMAHERVRAVGDEQMRRHDGELEREEGAEGSEAGQPDECAAERSECTGGEEY